MSNQPVTCIEESCSKHKVNFYNGSNQCPSCGNQMFPVEDVKSSVNTLEDADFSEDMFERMSGRAFVDSPRLFPTVVKQDDTFHCTPDLRGCPIAKQATVYIPIDLFNKWIFLAGQLKTEWIAYLTGNIKEGTEDEYEITGMYFPKQKANAAHCEAEDGEIKEGTIAAVHSHVGMEVFFSKEDQDHFNHNIELVVNNKGSILATGRTKLECGRYHRGAADMIFVGCEEEMALEEELKGKLTKESTVFTVLKGKPNGHGQMQLP